MTGAENYKEFFYALVGIAGEGQNFDGNGMYVRFQTGGGSQTVSLGSKSAGTGQLFGNNVQVPLGNRPAYPGKRPPYKPEAPCYQQKIPDLNGPAAAKSLPTGSTADTAQVKSVRDKLRREADLGAVRKKLHPFGTAKKANPATENAK
jgi:phospholipid/cholesterol/gamma-HCH transport system substrate-binding protein